MFCVVRGCATLGESVRVANVKSIQACQKAAVPRFYLIHVEGDLSKHVGVSPDPSLISLRVQESFLLLCHLSCYLLSSSHFTSICCRSTFIALTNLQSATNSRIGGIIINNYMCFNCTYTLIVFIL